jgi:hypothetical protein
MPAATNCLPADPAEVGLTNLGPVPEGLTFLEATIAMRGERKFAIDYYRKGDRLTICDTLRQMWRETDRMPESEARDAVREYIAACADFSKRMDARLTELKNRA